MVDQPSRRRFQDGTSIFAAIASALVIVCLCPLADAAQGGKPLPAATSANLKYGSDARQGIDLWIPKVTTSQPLPALCVFFHGGGFTSGDKSELPLADLQAFIGEGFAVASVNYRYRPYSYDDSALAIRFLRARAATLKYQESQMFAYGTSAGACVVLWLGYHADMANPSAQDPLLRRSTRLTAVGTIDGQTTIQPLELRSWFGPVTDQMGPQLLEMLGLTSMDQLNDPTEKAKLADRSAYGLASADDPPTFIVQNQPDVTVTPENLLHHPRFGQKLQARLQMLGVPMRYVGTVSNRGLEMAKFFHSWLMAPGRG